ncbi:MAG TPA: RNA polymerase sigma factor [Opitutaceae bacterium]
MKIVAQFPLSVCQRSSDTHPPRWIRKSGKHLVIAPKVADMPPLDSHQQQWFAEHLWPHEGMLRAWLRSRFPVVEDIDDIVQEAYLRVLRAHESNCHAITSPKAFLFTTARNLVLMQLRHRGVERTDALAEIDTSDILDEKADVAGRVVHEEELEILTKAIQSLPTRCRQILTLRKIYGLSQREVASQLGVSEHTVEAQGTIGLRKLAAYFERIEHRAPLRHE